jgi:hypothetical protein
MSRTPAIHAVHAAAITRAARRRRGAGLVDRNLRFGLWLPLTPVLALLAPLALVGAPCLLLHPIARRASPLRLAWILGAVLLGLSGTAIRVETPRVQIQIRIF